MATIKASNFRDFQEQLNYLNNLERKELEELEGRLRRISADALHKMTLQELRKNQPDYLLPPIEVQISSLEDPHHDYHCPYCNVTLYDAGNQLSCKFCNKKWSKKSVFEVK